MNIPMWIDPQRNLKNPKENTDPYRGSSCSSKNSVNLEKNVKEIIEINIKPNSNQIKPTYIEILENKKQKQNPAKTKSKPTQTYNQIKLN